MNKPIEVKKPSKDIVIDLCKFIDVDKFSHKSDCNKIAEKIQAYIANVLNETGTNAVVTFKEIGDRFPRWGYMVNVSMSIPNFHYEQELEAYNKYLKDLEEYNLELERQKEEKEKKNKQSAPSNKKTSNPLIKLSVLKGLLEKVKANPNFDIVDRIEEIVSNIEEK